ncbi:MAG: metalloregulator ArsR/SmtB family transcription factor [bacterium]
MTNEHRDFKNAIYEQLARVGKSVSSPRRLELLDLLCQGPKTVETLARESGLSTANTSQHLQVLRGARLVETQKKGLHVTYRLAGEDVCEFYRTLRLLAESHLSAIDRTAREYLEQRDQLEEIDGPEVLERLRREEITVIDVRPGDEYRTGHLPGARSVPLDELEARLAELPPDRAVVAYCRGPYCVLAVKAVELLRERGFDAIRMADGVADLRAQGLDVTKEEQP